MRFSFLGIVVVLFGIVPLFTYAQSDATSTASSTESGGLFATIIENVTGIKDTVTEAVPTSQSVLEPKTEKRLTNLAANISNRLDGLNARLRQIAGRLEDRIEKQAALGYDVEPAKKSLQQAYTELDAASKELEGIDLKVYRAFRSLTPKEDWQQVRATYVSTRDTIRKAHVELKATVSHLKTAVPSAPIATTTASTTL